MKFAVPTLFGLAWGFSTLELWRGTPYAPDGSLPAEFIRWLFLVLWIAILSFMLWVCGGLKRVEVDHTTLYVSNYFREERVPLSSIKDVTEIRWINIHPVTIHIRSDTPFGRQITFMPIARFSLISWLSPHPVVEELKDLAAPSPGLDASRLK